MKNIIILSTLLYSIIILFTSAFAKEVTTSSLGINSSLGNKNIAPRTIEWTDLMPEEDLKILESMQSIDHDAFSTEELAEDKATDANWLRSRNATSRFEDSVTAAIVAANKPNQRTYQDVLNSYSVRPEFKNKKIKLAGYAVPLEYNAKKMVTAFFLVPYFGACIHVPPPPPNQIIYVRVPKGIKITDIYNPFWVAGLLRIETTEKDNGASAYSLDAESVTEYKEE